MSQIALFAKDFGVPRVPVGEYMANYRPARALPGKGKKAKQKK